MDKLPKAARVIPVKTTINGQAWEGEVGSEETLLSFLRDRLSLKGTKRSCESQVCGACTVLVDGLAISSCSYLAWEARGKEVLTIEGLASGDRLEPVQEAFVKHSAIQCGYCTPGMIMMVKALLMEKPRPSREEIREWLNGSICRCGSYIAIQQAIFEAAGGGG